jgi:hypothetical protein
MFLAAVFTLVIHSQCRAPAILGFVSCLIRDSIYFEGRGEHGNSAGNGSDKSRRLGAMKVMIADVGIANERAGKIAFVPVGIGMRVEKGKWYA